jgi:hypothetical protein
MLLMQVGFSAALTLGPLTAESVFKNLSIGNSKIAL